MKKLKQIILGTSWIWLPMIGTYIAELLVNILTKVL